MTDKTPSAPSGPDTLKALCQSIADGYAADKSMLDAGMIDKAAELTGRTSEIVALLDDRQALARHLERMCDTYSAALGSHAALEHPAFRDSRALLSKTVRLTARVGSTDSLPEGWDDFARDHRESMMERLVAVAQEHGEDSEPDHEVGDLQDLLRPMWKLLTPAQQRAYLALPEVQGVVEGAGLEQELLTLQNVGDLDQDEWDEVCEHFGIDDSFQYPDESVVEFVNSYRLDGYGDGPESHSSSTPKARSAE